MTRSPRNSTLEERSPGENLVETRSKNDGSILRRMGRAVKDFLNGRRGVRENADRGDGGVRTDDGLDPASSMCEGKHLGIVVGGVPGKRYHYLEDSSPFQITH